ncbi:hypothetical protein TRVL_09231 [Trypanosoma vivax]|nr:hypothetical protein TRVL_09231 [Trypanosoma vivax]
MHSCRFRRGVLTLPAWRTRSPSQAMHAFHIPLVLYLSLHSSLSSSALTLLLSHRCWALALCWAHARSSSFSRTFLHFTVSTSLCATFYALNNTETPLCCDVSVLCLGHSFLSSY